MGRALAHLIERLPTDKLPTPGGTPAVITVNIDLADLKKRVGAATLTTGTRISSSELRGATTNINDGTLLCSRHHHQAHDENWQFRQATDGTIEIKKPRDVWRRNHRWRPWDLTRAGPGGTSAHECVTPCHLRSL